jgi:hypothetical protein
VQKLSAYISLALASKALDTGLQSKGKRGTGTPIVPLRSRGRQSRNNASEAVKGTLTKGSTKYCSDTYQQAIAKLSSTLRDEQAGHHSYAMWPCKNVPSNPDHAERRTGALTLTGLHSRVRNIGNKYLPRRVGTAKLSTITNRTA